MPLRQPTLEVSAIHLFSNFKNTRATVALARAKNVCDVFILLRIKDERNRMTRRQSFPLTSTSFISKHASYWAKQMVDCHVIQNFTLQVQESRQ